jgi:hypothetical protein
MATATAFEHSDRVLEAFTKVARPPLVRAWGRNCCINATRAAILVLRHFGVKAEPFPCKLVVEDRAKNLAKMVGFTKEERQEHTANLQPERVIDLSVPDEGWAGHLAALVEKRALLDPSFDQAAEPDMGLVIPEHVLMVPVPESFARGEQMIVMEGSIDDGPALRIRYWPSEDQSFKIEEAWLGLDSCVMAAHIALLMEDALRRRTSDVP